MNLAQFLGGRREGGGAPGPAADFEPRFPAHFHPLASQWTSLTGKSNQLRLLC